MADNTDEEHLDIPINTQSENPTDEIIPTTDTETINSIQEPENMEVHNHAHHGGKKNWKSYFWEFLMLFLAVFCGFLAEYQLEHMIEHDREKQYMESMLDDLKQDTSEIRSRIRFIDNYFRPVLTKSIELLYSENFSDSAIKEMYDTVPKATRFFTINIQDNAITQLKNSGNLRLIRKKEITDSLVKYWYSCKGLLNTLLPGYEATRINSKELVFSLFNHHYFEKNIPYLPLRKGISFKLLSNDKVQFIKLGNNIANLNGQLTGAILGSLKEMNQKATDLIALIRKEYHIE